MKEVYKIDIKRNKSTTYMLPFLDSELKLEFKHQILNSYLSFEKDDSIFCILYDWNSGSEFLKFEGELMENELFLGHEDYDDKCLYKFRLTNKMLAGRQTFIEGRHSDFSISHKKFIEDYITDMGFKNAINILLILDPKRLRTSTKPDMNKETFINHLTIISLKPKELYGNKKVE